MDWHRISYLLDGTPRQKDAYQALTGLKIWDYFAAHNPVLVGTIPLDIEVDSSDLDVLFHFGNLDDAESRFMSVYCDQANFRLRRKYITHIESVIANFTAYGFEIELFAQTIPTSEQTAFRHMVIEHHLLRFGGEVAKITIRQLKRGGMKTEPAFAHYFEIRGDDPYAALLGLDLTQYILK